MHHIVSAYGGLNLYSFQLQNVFLYYLKNTHTIYCTCEHLSSILEKQIKVVARGAPAGFTLLMTN